MMAAFADELIKIGALRRRDKVLEFLQLPMTKADALNVRTYFRSQYPEYTEKLRKRMTRKGYESVRDYAETKPLVVRGRSGKTKVALAPPSLAKALRTPFSSSTLNRQSFKSIVPRVGSVGRVAPATQTAAGSIVTPVGGIRGANLRKPTTIDPKMPLTQGTPPASPVHVAPQVNPQAGTIQQGAPQTVNSAAPTAGGAGAPPSAPSAQGGRSSGRISR